MKLPTERLKNEMITWRRTIHKFPELGFNEIRTTKLISDLLTSFGLKIYEHFSKTGVIAHLEKNNTKKLIAIRADIDALPINEETSFDYKSQNDGVMHACGHDGHTATLLGAAKFLSEDASFDGNILFIFQPDEENGRGALSMIESGLLEAFNISEIYALHNIPGMPIGYFATRENTITASESSFKIEVQTKGGHAALPNMGGDALLIASQLVTTLQTIVSRKIDPRKNAVFSITEFLTNGKKNILASNATLKGDARCFDDDTKSILKSEMQKICNGIANANNASCLVKFVTNFPITNNSSIPTQNLISCLKETYGGKRINSNCSPMMFSEDFSFLTNKVNGCFVLMGNGTHGANAEPLHSPNYDFNDNALTHGSSLWVNLAKTISSKK